MWERRSKQKRLPFNLKLVHLEHHRIYLTRNVTSSLDLNHLSVCVCVRLLFIFLLSYWNTCEVRVNRMKGSHPLRQSRDRWKGIVSSKNTCFLLPGAGRRYLHQVEKRVGPRGKSYRTTRFNDTNFMFRVTHVSLKVVRSVYTTELDGESRDTEGWRWRKIPLRSESCKDHTGTGFISVVLYYRVVI